MHELLPNKINHVEILSDNSMNDDSFLHELLQSQKSNNDFTNQPQTNEKMLIFAKEPQSHKLILPLNKEIHEQNQKRSHQIFEQSQQSKQFDSEPSLTKNNNQILLFQPKIIHQTQNKNHPNHSHIIFETIKKCDHQKKIHEDIKSSQKQKSVNKFSLISKRTQKNKPKIQQIKKIQQRLTKIQVQEQKKKIKQEQNKKKKQKILEQQKQKLQKIRLENQRFLEIKKQKDKKIKLFKNELEDLKSIKQKQILKNQQKNLLQEIQEHRRNQKKFYEAMMQEKLAIDKKIFQKEKQIRKKILQEHQNFKKVEKQKKLLRSPLNLDDIRKKQEENRKIDELKIFLQKRNSYQQKIKNLEFEMMKQKSKPVKEKSQMQKKSQERRINARSLSAAEIYRMGQQFMQEAHILIGPQLIQKSKLSFDKNVKQMRESSRTEYKDYLKESKLKRSQFSQSTGKLSSNSQIRELRNLIVKEQNSTDKLLKAKLLSAKLDQKVKKRVNTKLKADSIAVKLKIIEEFS